jgi:hypothetical protein
MTSAFLTKYISVFWWIFYISYVAILVTDKIVIYGIQEASQV